jgi:hypothetical protein
MSEANTITKEQIAEWRARIKAHREAKRAERAARRERAIERSEEINRHLAAAEQARIEAKAQRASIMRIAPQLATRRADVRALALKTAEHRALLRRANTERKAARDALKMLRAEIRGYAAAEA